MQGFHAAVVSESASKQQEIILIMHINIIMSLEYIN